MLPLALISVLPLKRCFCSASFSAAIAAGGVPTTAGDPPWREEAVGHKATQAAADMARRAWLRKHKCAMYRGYVCASVRPCS